MGDDRVKADDFHSYVNELNRLLRCMEYSKASSAIPYLSARDEHVLEDYFNNDKNHIPMYFVRRQIDDSWLTIVEQHIAFANAYRKGQYIKAYDEQEKLVKEFRKYVITKGSDNYWMPILDQICSDLRWIGDKADQEFQLKIMSTMDIENKAKVQADRVSYAEKASAPIMDCYRGCVADSRQDEYSKRLAILNLTNHLFRVYFKINKLNLLRPLIRQIEENSQNIWDSFSMSDKVTYRFFMGRKSMFDADLGKAEQYLEYALNNCPSDYKANQRAILIYLIPVKMFRGQMPTDQLLEEFNLTQYTGLALAVKQGNIRAFEAALEKNERFFIRSGLFLMLEKLKMITCRNLFKKVCAILNTSRIPLPALQHTLHYMGIEDIDEDETACITANLIADRKMKGYMSHSHKMLVLSKQNPFPPLS